MPPLPDVVEEGERLLRLADEAGVPLRLLGGVAIRLRTPNLAAAIARPYGDLDFVAAPGTSRAVVDVFREAGYEPDQAFNTLHGKRRLIFLDPANERKTDVFVGEFAMCHKIPVADRLELEPRTLPLAELLLTKLQVVELNEKDVRDALGVLAEHEVTDRDGDAVNATRIAELCAVDWGLWRTLTANLAAVRGHVGEYDLSDEERARAVRGVDGLLARIDAEPKSRGWRLRARIGERKRWYDLPEEV